MSIDQLVVTYLIIGIVWAAGNHGYSKEPTPTHDFCLSLAIWPIELGLLLISYIPMVIEEVMDRYEEWKNNIKK